MLLNLQNVAEDVSLLDIVLGEFKDRSGQIVHF